MIEVIDRTNREELVLVDMATDSVHWPPDADCSENWKALAKIAGSNQIGLH